MHFMYKDCALHITSEEQPPPLSIFSWHTGYSDERRTGDMLGFVYLNGDSESENFEHVFPSPKIAGFDSINRR